MSPVPVGSETEERPGWPTINQRLPRGSRQELRWLPPGAVNYPTLELQFSSNDGLMWQTVAAGLKPGRPVVWTVPETTGNGRICRLRIVAIAEAAGVNNRVESTLAMTQQFTVTSVPATMPAKP